MLRSVDVVLLAIMTQKSYVSGNSAADFSIYLPPLKVACRKGFAALAAIAAEFFK